MTRQQVQSKVIDGVVTALLGAATLAIVAVAINVFTSGELIRRLGGVAAADFEKAAADLEKHDIGGMFTVVDQGDHDFKSVPNPFFENKSGCPDKYAQILVTRFVAGNDKKGRPVGSNLMLCVRSK